MAIHQLIYHSTATAPMGEEELAQLVTQARHYNGDRAITGVLFYADQQFLYLLDGTQVAV